MSSQLPLDSGGGASVRPPLLLFVHGLGPLDVPPLGAILNSCMLFFVSHLGSCSYKLIALGGYIAWEPAALAETWFRFGFGVVSVFFVWLGFRGGYALYELHATPGIVRELSPIKKVGPSMRNCLSRALACACFVALVVVIKHAKTAGAVLRHKVDWPSLRGGRVGGSPRSCATSGAGTKHCFRRGTLTWSGPARLHGVQPSSDDAPSTT